MYRRKGIPYRTPMLPLGTTRRSTGNLDIAARAEVIRTQVARYCHRHKNLKETFEMWFGAYLFDQYRDAEYLCELLPIYRERLANAEITLEANDPMLATITITLAKLLLEIGQREEATKYFTLAAQRCRRVEHTTEAGRDRQRVLLQAIAEDLLTCKCAT